jgi:hypothetical protein
MSNGEIRNAAFQYWQIAERAAVSGLSRDTIISWMFIPDQGFVSFDVIPASVTQIMIPGSSRQSWDPTGEARLYIVSPIEAAAIDRTYAAMTRQLAIYPGRNNSIGMHYYRNTSFPRLPDFPGGLWYTAPIFTENSVSRLLVNTSPAARGIFFYSPDHYSWFMLGYSN